MGSALSARRRNPGGEFFAASPGLEGTFSDARKGSPAGMRPESGPLACPFNMDPCRRGNGTRPRMHVKRHGITRPATLYSYWDRRQFRQWSHQRIRSRDGRISRQGAQSPRASDRHRRAVDDHVRQRRQWRRLEYALIHRRSERRVRWSVRQPRAQRMTRAVRSGDGGTEIAPP